MPPPICLMRPAIILNFAISADGKTSTVGLDAARFTSRRDLRRLHEIRRQADAILVGRGTLEVDSMTMTVPAELRPKRQPLRCVVSRAGSFDPSHPLFRTPGGAVHLLVTEPAPSFDPSPFEAVGARVHSGSLGDFLSLLRERHGVETLLCEGGGTLVRSLAELGFIDQVHLTLAGHTLLGGAAAPTMTGPPGPYLPASLAFELTHFEPLENGECFLSYRRA